MNNDDDASTTEQRGYYHVLQCMIAEAQRPTTQDGMRAELSRLRREANQKARHLQVPSDQWHDELGSRMRRLTKALGYPLPKGVADPEEGGEQ